MKLPIEDITKLVVENIKNIETKEIRTKRITPNSQILSTEDKRKINSIRFLIFDPKQYYEALIQANSIMRYFILNSKPLAADAVLSQLPKDFIADLKLLHFQQEKFVNHLREFESLEIYLKSLQKYREFYENQQNKPQEPIHSSKTKKPSDEIEFDHQMKQYHRNLSEWEETDEELYQESKDQLYNLLQFENIWLRNLDEDFDLERDYEIQNVKKKCIPSTALLLFSLMFQRKEFDGCRGLAELVADEYYQHYKYFNDDELVQFLKLITEVC